MAVVMGEEALLWKRGKTVGKGSFGIVSLASTSNVHDHHHVALLNGVPPLPLQIAVKSCKFSNSRYVRAESEFLRMFQESPYVIRFFGVNVTQENGVILYNLLLEYASGGSLADCLDEDMNSRKGLKEYEVGKHTKNVLLGLSHVHSKGVIHCDIKPHNILVVGTDRIAKIADFGLAMTLEESSEKEHGIRGTKRYMAPESVIYHQYGTEVDIWALGCTVYELLTGKPLWKTSSDINDVKADVLHKIAFEKPKIQNAKVSKEARDFLKRCLDKNPRSRWTAEMLLNHPFLNSSNVHPTKTRKKQSDMSLLRRIFKTQPHIRDLIKARIDAIMKKKLERKLVEGY
ncbi:PREDICTED: mitogen-activated protein kinase kinase kinase 3-like [Nicotiana attenuata]|uniref:Mitogen-activated protein kinase kinase kinase npk1 n=1 Tax=Nicotiana attenuata TaxID=49451 RepID=A0A1J6I898_NICAT|nr:PREDICTED: mitogen-activated protein kinase kinase kinase 3-like [Nicotiana attenuata]OIT00668.1 mitogen-activated protein kinase kinase kinase npk1 [Nicotiana attenuata]